MAGTKAMILCEHGPGAAPALFSGASEVILARDQAWVLPNLAALDRTGK